MQLKEIYGPIEKELEHVETILKETLKKSKNKSVLRINNFLLDSPGKRIRPALMIFSAKAAAPGLQPKAQNIQLINIATAIELIHMASLIHDDVIDHSYIRHNKPTINYKWGVDVSIALGDYLYSVAFELVSNFGNSDIVRCVSAATKAMCEGELIQVSERDNVDLLKEKYIVIVKKKTASLFAASCKSGTLVFDSKAPLQNALNEYGLNFGIAFQIIDDYLDIAWGQKKLGKTPGQDIEVGEITLPMLNLLEAVPKHERAALKESLTSGNNKELLKRIRPRLLNTKASRKTREIISSYMNLANKKINVLTSSPYKESLLNLTDFITNRGFSDKD